MRITKKEATILRIVAAIAIAVMCAAMCGGCAV
jgi:hypothetical protein